MRKFLLCLMLVSLFLCAACAGISELLKSIEKDYVEGEILITMDAPLTSNYMLMGTFKNNYYSQVLSNKAKGLAKSCEIKAHGTFHAIAKFSGKTSFIFVQRIKPQKNWADNSRPLLM